MKRRLLFTQTLIVTLGLSTLSGCCGKADGIDNDAEIQNGERCTATHPVEFRNDTLPFFGMTVLMDDSTHIMQQIKEIAESDSMLSLDGNVLTVVETGFGVNLHSDGITLITSEQVESPKVEAVVEYLDGLYGKASVDDEVNYWWRLDEYHAATFPYAIRLRPLRSDDGGTVVMFCR